MNVADVAVQTIRADKNIEYSEIKFFKVLRSNLKVVTDETLLEKIEGIDENYLAQDIVLITYRCMMTTSILLICLSSKH